MLQVSQITIEEDRKNSLGPNEISITLDSHLRAYTSYWAKGFQYAGFKFLAKRPNSYITKNSFLTNSYITKKAQDPTLGYFQ